ncbi:MULTISPECIES: urease accessory protein UreD [Paenibacillus]|uniref:urease accessory protein UreD n=1 Tax=Paenibacillus TaxID=44249 RepID=UPI0022B894B3|nr:urease accessory protein UreD [Paenibacillus caseinilyticus]MCZ8522344.1 urease accessory protein UreD [Paenibacillus caseinilyticus]
MPRVTGSIAAALTRTGGATQLQSHSQSYPLKIAKTFPFPGQSLGVYVMDASPGIMAGDRYDLQWRFREGTRAYITNQSYTKVHPSRRGEDQPWHPSAQRQSLVLGPDSYVEYMPEPLMLYADAVLDAVTSIEMKSGSSLFLSDIVCPGRSHRGETFHYERYANRLTVSYEDELIFSGRQKVEPGRSDPRSVSRWDTYTHAGSLYLFSDRIRTEHAQALRTRMEERYAAFPQLYFGSSMTYKHGLAVQVLGLRVYEIQELLEDVWGFLRSEIFGLEPLRVPK